MKYSSNIDEMQYEEWVHTIQQNPEFNTQNILMPSKYEFKEGTCPTDNTVEVIFQIKRFNILYTNFHCLKNVRTGGV